MTRHWVKYIVKVGIVTVDPSYRNVSFFISINVLEIEYSHWTEIRFEFSQVGSTIGGMIDETTKIQIQI